MTERGPGSTGRANLWQEINERRTALYRFYGADRQLLYVGITCNVEERFKDHARDKRKPWWPEVAEHTIEWFEDRAKAAHAETHAIVTEVPQYNIAHSGTHYRINYKFSWLQRQLNEEEKHIRTPRHTPRSKRGQKALAEALERQQIVDEHRPGAPLKWDGRNLTSYSHRRDGAPRDIRQYMQWFRERDRYTVIYTERWSGCGSWPAEALWLETRRRQGECPICVGEQAPCQVIRRIVERYKNQPYFPL